MAPTKAELAATAKAILSLPGDSPHPLRRNLAMREGHSAFTDYPPMMRNYTEALTGSSSTAGSNSKKKGRRASNSWRKDTTRRVLRVVNRGPDDEIAEDESAEDEIVQKVIDVSLAAEEKKKADSRIHEIVDLTAGEIDGSDLEKAILASKALEDKESEARQALRASGVKDHPKRKRSGTRIPDNDSLNEESNLVKYRPSFTKFQIEALRPRKVSCRSLRIGIEMSQN